MIGKHKTGTTPFYGEAARQSRLNTFLKTQRRVLQKGNIIISKNMTICQ